MSAVWPWRPAEWYTTVAKTNASNNCTVSTLCANQEWIEYAASVERNAMLAKTSVLNRATSDTPAVLRLLYWDNES